MIHSPSQAKAIGVWLEFPWMECRGSSRKRCSPWSSEELRGRQRIRSDQVRGSRGALGPALRVVRLVKGFFKSRNGCQVILFGDNGHEGLTGIVIKAGQAERPWRVLYLYESIFLQAF